ncbi:uncharacterized protein LOC129595316 [Paramacrobiotus metropolitanus]|uniref:uncharacterized protein LOC129595316 n=1 Tax=Paramacrobiotus metropolitanus TaxID=2943436 RepID=UPI0024461DAB|nr:uncharacterized protein LOC129595316 [Paramacrobiotus metropolitanus]
MKTEAAARISGTPGITSGRRGRLSRASLCIVVGCVFLVMMGGAYATLGYYRTYTVYGTGDNIISTFCAHGGPGPGHPWRKWNVECLDGEAVIGILDSLSDYQNIGNVWCKYMFPYKPPTNGIYPYYPNCFSKNMTFQFFCYTPKYHDASVDSFIVGFYDDDFSFNIYRKTLDDPSPYKCCKAPTGYYIDYSSCYYFPTHDQFWEYYDTPQYFLVYCTTGYVMTGIGKKVNPYTTEAHIEWIQCCRLGFGTVPNIMPAPPPLADDYYYPSNVSSYSGGEEARPSRPYTGLGGTYGAGASQASGRSLFQAEDGTLVDKGVDLQHWASIDGKMSALWHKKQEL